MKIFLKWKKLSALFCVWLMWLCVRNAIRSTLHIKKIICLSFAIGGAAKRCKDFLVRSMNLLLFIRSVRVSMTFWCCFMNSPFSSGSRRLFAPFLYFFNILYKETFLLQNVQKRLLHEETLSSWKNVDYLLIVSSGTLCFFINQVALSVEWDKS